jgi:hypothetical protein
LRGAAAVWLAIDPMQVFVDQRKTIYDNVRTWSCGVFVWRVQRRAEGTPVPQEEDSSRRSQRRRMRREIW